MRAAIFTETSNTTGKVTEDSLVKNHFKGTFLSIKSLETELSNYAETEMYVFSEEFGWLRGSEPSTQIEDSKANSEKTLNSYQETLLEVANQTDVLILLFKVSNFEKIVTNQWDELVSSIQPGTIVCLGTSRNTLKSIDTAALEDKDCDLHIYERVGVARIGSEVKNQLVKSVKATSK